MKAYYETRFAQAKDKGLSDAMAADVAATALLDGKPANQGKRKVQAAERHTAFWSADFISGLLQDAWAQESMVLALARYLGQHTCACPGLVAHVASVSPDTVQRAARYAGLVLQQDSSRWREVAELAGSWPAEFGEFVRVFGIFNQARSQRVADVERVRQPLAGLTPLEMLAYASLYAFERIVPAHLGAVSADEALDAALQSSWDAIDAILAWTLGACDPACMQLDDAAIGRSLSAHLSPFLFPSPQTPPRHDLYVAFCALVDAQTELHEFDSRSADAFSYDDSIRFVLTGTALEIEIIDANAKAVWQRENVKLARLQQYWVYRGMHALLAAPELLARVSPANLDANLQALAKAFSAWLQLQEVYGVDARVVTDSGLQVDVFGALQAIELMTAFYIEDFLRPYSEYLQEYEHPWLALGQLAFNGFSQGENRLPITWSDHAAKIARIRPWTATRERPQGHPRAAEAILDFWTSDWKALAEKLQLKGGQAGLRPRLQERPILKMGRQLFVLPWMLAMQNNSVAAINNLRRIGSGRHEAQKETRRIEQRLGALFEGRGFKVLVGHELPALPTVASKPGDIDLLCARDGCLLLLELKSSFFRRSQKDAWMHRTMTLRKAGLQLRRKLAAVHEALEADASFRRSLGLDVTPALTAWIVDTSIECDHQRFNGFLKVSLEELVVALRDDGFLLNDPGGLFSGSEAYEEYSLPGELDGATETLYPNGFSAGSFIDAIESEAIWAGVE